MFRFEQQIKTNNTFYKENWSRFVVSELVAELLSLVPTPSTVHDLSFVSYVL